MAENTAIDLAGIPALTLLNPWAALVAHHGKNIENRTWAPPASLGWLLIHAGKRWDNDVDAHWIRQRFGVGFDEASVRASAIVAVARLTRSCSTSRWSDTLRCDCGKWAAAGQCHWGLEVHPLPEPVQCSGRQRLWQPPAAVVAAVTAQRATDYLRRQRLPAVLDRGQA